MRSLVTDIIKKEGKEVEVMGWVDARRDHGKIIFIDIRDRTGISQIVFVPSEKDTYAIAETLRPEWVVRIKGMVKARPENMRNEKIETGQHEIEAQELEVINEAQTPPFPLDTGGYDIEEEVRLKYRYLDLRRERLQKNIKLRSRFLTEVRNFLLHKDFTEIETPILTKSTPEGARDFIVPSRLHQGKFFALPQSPQQYKQLLMVAGFERYFQIAKCFRDEDLRADRGFEHTQIDLEMSFMNREEVMTMDEDLITTVVEKLGYTIKEKPFPRISYAEAMEKHKIDRPDLRSEEDKKNGVLAFVWINDFPFFEKDKAGKWTFTHNPFSNPKPEFEADLLAGKNIENIVTSQYDMVCNGYEIGGGSIRAHKPEILQAVFKVLGYDEKVINKQFGHMLEALSYGAPPHGGIAHGVERILMTLTGEEYLREVQAFPQTSSGRTAVMDAPAEVDERQLNELHIKTKKT